MFDNKTGKEIAASLKAIHSQLEKMSSQLDELVKESKKRPYLPPSPPSGGGMAEPKDGKRPSSEFGNGYVPPSDFKP